MKTKLENFKLEIIDDNGSVYVCKCVGKQRGDWREEWAGDDWVGSDLLVTFAVPELKSCDMSFRKPGCVE